MNWKKWLGYNVYKKLWSILGGRPWTYIARDLYHQFEYVWLVSIFVGGFAVGISGRVSWKWFLIIMIAYTVGYIHGHFFWGTTYTPDEKEN